MINFSLYFGFTRVDRKKFKFGEMERLILSVGGRDGLNISCRSTLRPLQESSWLLTERLRDIESAGDLVGPGGTWWDLGYLKEVGEQPVAAVSGEQTEWWVVVGWWWGNIIIYDSDDDQGNINRWKYPATRVSIFFFKVIGLTATPKNRTLRYSYTTQVIIYKKEQEYDINEMYYSNMVRY